MTPIIEDQATVLFQGDSITDASRDKQNPDAMGNGYAMMASAWFSARFPEKKVRFLNRGISGNRAKDLAARWQTDCIDLQPSWLSIMIGVNDTWRRFDRNDPTSTEAYEEQYRYCLDQVQAHLTCRVILITPFVLPCPPDRLAWREDIEPRIVVVRKLAAEYGALLVEMDDIINRAAMQRPPEFWAADGVHPSPAGHALIAQSWLRTVGAMD